jgi:hypothetical protein
VQRIDAITYMKERKKEKKRNLFVVHNRAAFRGRFRFKFGSCTLST